MQRLSTSNLMHAWEDGLNLHPTLRAIQLVMVGYPGLSNQDAKALSIGSRDALLIRLRQVLFGSSIVSTSTCNYCQEQMDLSFDLSTIKVDDPKPNVRQTVTIQDYQIEFRLPCSSDLIEQNAPAPTNLLSKCIQSVNINGKAVSFDQLDLGLIQKAADHIANLDGAANIQINIECPSCGELQTSRFNILSFLWQEIDTWARLVLHEIHLLASRYGWSERSILEMNPIKRRLYLQMVVL